MFRRQQSEGERYEFGWNVWEECSLEVGVSEHSHITLPPSPEPFPDRLQCLNLSTVSSEMCRAVFPGRVTENMLCAGGEAGKDACQVNPLRVVTTVRDRKEKRKMKP